MGVSVTLGRTVSDGVGLYRDPACWYPDEQLGWAAPCWVCRVKVKATEASDRCFFCRWVICSRCGACTEPNKVSAGASASGKRMCVCPCGVLAGGRWGARYSQQLETFKKNLRRGVPMRVGDSVEWRRGSRVVLAVVVREHNTDPAKPALVVRTDDGQESGPIELASGRLRVAVDFEPLLQAARDKGLCETHRNLLRLRRQSPSSGL